MFRGIKNKLVRLILLLAGILIIPAPVFSQVQNLHITGSYNANFMLTPNEPDFSVLGSPYLNEQFMFGKVLLKDGSKMETLIRYNIYSQSLEVIVEKDTLEMVKVFFLENFVLNNRQFVYRLYTGKEFNEIFLAADFFEVLHQAGELELLRHHRMDVETNIAISNYMGGIGDGRDYYVHKTSLYLVRSDNSSLEKLDTRRKEFLDLFGENKDKVESFIESNKLKLNKEEDILEIFNYYKSLVA